MVVIESPPSFVPCKRLEHVAGTRQLSNQRTGGGLECDELETECSGLETQLDWSGMRDVSYTPSVLPCPFRSSSSPKKFHPDIQNIGDPGCKN